MHSYERLLVIIIIIIIINRRPPKKPLMAVYISTLKRKQCLQEALKDGGDVTDVLRSRKRISSEFHVV